MPDTPEREGAARESDALKIRVTAARDLLAKLGRKTPALWEMRAAVAALREAERRGAECERGRILRTLTNYMRGCEGAAVELAEAEDEAGVNMYWRADGASDALECLIDEIRASDLRAAADALGGEG